MIRLIVVCSVCCLLAGCLETAPRFVSVSGTVTAYGQPVEGANVLFVPASVKDARGRKLVISHGVTDAEGRYKLSMPGGVSGASLGRHQVLISRVDLVLDDLDAEKVTDVKTETDDDEIAEPAEARQSLAQVIAPQMPSRRSLILQAAVSSNPFKTPQPLAETIFDSFNLETVLEFDVPAAGADNADFEVGQDPLLRD